MPQVDQQGKGLDDPQIWVYLAAHEIQEVLYSKISWHAQNWGVIEECIKRTIELAKRYVVNEIVENHGNLTSGRLS